jgi:hypothetical protein
VLSQRFIKDIRTSHDQKFSDRIRLPLFSVDIHRSPSVSFFSFGLFLAALFAVGPPPMRELSGETGLLCSLPSHFFHRSLFFSGRYCNRLGRWSMTHLPVLPCQNTSPSAPYTIHTSLPITVGGSKHRAIQNDSQPIPDHFLLLTRFYSKRLLFLTSQLLQCVCMFVAPIVYIRLYLIYPYFREGGIYTVLSPLILFTKRFSFGFFIFSYVI